MPMKPNFIGIGPGRSGTTYIHNLLGSHPSVYMPRVKETNYFISNDHLDEDSFEQYLSTHFSGVKSETVIGEISPGYMTPWAILPGASSRGVASAIQRHLGPETKIIINLRSPISRLFSQFKFNLRLAANTKSKLEQLINIGTADDPFFCHQNSVDLALIADDVEAFIEIFGRINILPLIYEKDIAPNGLIALNKLSSFLSIDPPSISKEAASKKINGTESLEIFFGAETPRCETSRDGRSSGDRETVELEENQMFLRSGWYPLDAKLSLDYQEEKVWRQASQLAKNGLTKKKELSLNNLLYRHDILRIERSLGINLKSYWLP